MVLATRIEQLTACLIKLNLFFSEKNRPNSAVLTLGNQALALVNDLIAENPNDFNLRCNRIKLNSDWLFKNYKMVLADAQFIVDHSLCFKFKKFGYKWLEYANDKIGTPQKGIQILENKLIDIHLFQTSLHQQNTILGQTYYNLAKLYLVIGKQTYAYELLETSYQYNPYMADRNFYLGLYLLKSLNLERAETYLWAHFLFSHSTSEKTIQYGKLLKKLYDNNELDQHPNLIALLFHIIRKHKTAFACFAVTDFFNLYGERLILEVKKHPDNSKLQMVLANCYFLDFNNLPLALVHYKSALAGSTPFYQSYLVRMVACLDSPSDFFSHFTWPDPQSLQTNDIFGFYQMASDFYDLYFETQNERFLKKGEFFIKQAYDTMSVYFKNNQGTAYCNSVMYYNLVCNLYGKILTTYANFSVDIEHRQTLLVCAASVYWDGFKLAQTPLSLELALTTVYKAQNIDLFVLYVAELARGAAQFSISVNAMQTIYLVSYNLLKNEDLPHLTLLFDYTKKIYDKLPNITETYFEIYLNLAFDFFTLSIQNNTNFDIIYKEINPLLTRKDLQNQHPDIYGVLLYYVGICCTKQNKIRQAKSFFKQAILVLKHVDDQNFADFYQQVYLADMALK